MAIIVLSPHVDDYFMIVTVRGFVYTT